MKVLENYFHLFFTFFENHNTAVNVTRAQLADVLQCSERNVIHILNKLEGIGWIERRSGSGRGNFSSILFKKSMQELFLAISNEEIGKVIQLLEKYNKGIRKDIYKEILHIFGYRQMIDQDNEVHDILRIPYFRRILSLDPIDVERQTERHLVMQIFDTLVEYDPDSKSVKPHLALYWQQRQEGKDWIFYLRKGVTFHGGEEFTSKDVQFTFERMKQTSAHWFVNTLERVEILTRYAVSFHFKNPNYLWDLLLTSPKCSIVPFGYGVGVQRDFKAFPNGTGPFRIMAHKEEHISLCSFREYFRGRPQVDEIHIHFLPSIEKYVNQKEIDYLPFHMNGGREEHLHYVERKNLSVKYLLWNTVKSKNLHIRNALGGMLDKVKLVNDLGYPRYKATTSFLKENNYLQRDKEIQIFTEQEKIVLMTYELGPHQQDVKWIQKQCELYGIKVETLVVPYPELMREENINKADLILHEYVREEVEEVSFHQLFLSENGVLSKVLGKQDRKLVNERLESAKELGDIRARVEIYSQIEQYLLDQNIVQPLYSTFQRAYFQDRLMGVSLNHVGLVPFKDLFYRKE